MAIRGEIVSVGGFIGQTRLTGKLIIATNRVANIYQSDFRIYQSN